MAKFCNMCGNKLDENATKCPKCNKVINQKIKPYASIVFTEEKNEAPKGKKTPSFFKKNVVIISLVAFISIGLIVFGLSKINFGATKTSSQDALSAIETSFDYIVNIPEGEKNLTSIAKAGTEIVVVDIVEQDDMHYAECDITTYDFSGVMMTYAKENGAKEMTNDAFLSEIEAKLQESEKITTHTQILLEKNSDGETEAKLTEEQLDILLGGYLTFAQEYVDMLKGQQVN